jgi:hypothetical protein
MGPLVANPRTGSTVTCARSWQSRAPRHLCRQAETRQRPLAGLLDEKHNQAGSRSTTRITACTLPEFLSVSCESLA